MTHSVGSYSDIVVLVGSGVLEQALNMARNSINPKNNENFFWFIIVYFSQGLSDKA